MKNRTLNIALFSLVAVCTSCNKVTESIQQDVIVYDTVKFDIPILSSITSTTTTAEIPSGINLQKELDKSTNNFGINNITAVKIKSLNLTLQPIVKDSIDVKNNFGNLEIVRFRIANNGAFGNLAGTNISSSSLSRALNLTVNNIPDSLKSFLTGTVKNYSVMVKAKVATTAVMKVTAAATYTITLSK